MRFKHWVNTGEREENHRQEERERERQREMREIEREWERERAKTEMEERGASKKWKQFVLDNRKQFYCNLGNLKTAPFLLSKCTSIRLSLSYKVAKSLSMRFTPKQPGLWPKPGFMVKREIVLSHWIIIEIYWYREESVFEDKAPHMGQILTRTSRCAINSSS